MATTTKTDVQPATPESSAAPAVKAERYASKEVRTAIAERLEAVVELGFSRPVLRDLLAQRTGDDKLPEDERKWTLSAVWRAQNYKIHPDEVDVVTALLDDVEAGKIDVPSRSKANRVKELEEAVQAALLELSGDLDRLKLKELREAILAARRVLGGDVDVTDDAAAAA